MKTMIEIAIPHGAKDADLVKRVRHKYPEISYVFNAPIHEFILEGILSNADMEWWEQLEYSIPGAYSYVHLEVQGDDLVPLSTGAELRLQALQKVPKDVHGNLIMNWNHEAVRFKQAIAYLQQTDPLRPQYRPLGAPGPSATNVIVVQLDTGYSDHPKVVNTCYDISKSTTTVEKDEDQGKDPLRPMIGLKSGHGTSTAATFIGNPSKDVLTEGYPIYAEDYMEMDLNEGLFPYVTYIPVRIANHVVFNLNMFKRGFQDMLEGVKRAVELKAHVITLSMGGELFAPAALKAAKYAYHHGVIFVCAAGNTSVVDHIFGVVKPASYKHTIAVAGVEPNGNHDLVPWRNGCDGKQVDISAPSKFIYTAYKRVVKDDVQTKNVYKWGEGTSQGTVHVAAAAAAWWHCWEDELLNSPWFQRAGKRHRIVEAFRWALVASKYVPESWKGKKGKRYRRNNKGILDVARLLQPEFSPLAFQKQKASQGGMWK